MSDKSRETIELDPGGFNELRLCRSGPMVYNKFDIYVGGSLKKYGEFSWYEQELFRQIVQSGSIIVEVGANIGAHTIELSRLAGTDGAVFAFEPQRIVFQSLCANLALNQCVNVFAYQEALGAENGTIVVPAANPTIRNNFGGISLLGAETGELVPLRTLDSVDLPACHFLKADVEGMEVEVLAGSRDTIHAFRPILYLENDRGTRSRELLELVMGYEYDIYWHLPPLYNPDNFAGDREDVFPGIVSVNILCMPSESEIAINGMRRVTSPADTWQA